MRTLVPRPGALSARSCRRAPRRSAARSRGRGPCPSPSSCSAARRSARRRRRRGRRPRRGSRRRRPPARCARRSSPPVSRHRLERVVDHVQQHALDLVGVDLDVPGTSGPSSTRTSSRSRGACVYGRERVEHERVRVDPLRPHRGQPREARELADQLLEVAHRPQDHVDRGREDRRRSAPGRAPRPSSASPRRGPPASAGS